MANTRGKRSATLRSDERNLKFHPHVMLIKTVKQLLTMRSEKAFGVYGKHVFVGF